MNRPRACSSMAISSASILCLKLTRSCAEAMPPPACSLFCPDESCGNNVQPGAATYRQNYASANRNPARKYFHFHPVSARPGSSRSADTFLRSIEIGILGKPCWRDVHSRPASLPARRWRYIPPAADGVNRVLQTAMPICIIGLGLIEFFRHCSAAVVSGSDSRRWRKTQHALVHPVGFRIAGKEIFPDTSPQKCLVGAHTSLTTLPGCTRLA